MKENAIKKINYIGKAGLILSRILSVLMIIASIFLLIGTIAFAILPQDFLSIRMEGSGKIHVNMPLLMSMSLEENPDMLNEMTSTFYLNGSEFDMTNATATETGIVFDASGTLLNFTSNGIFKVLLVALCYAVLSIVIMFFISALCKAFRNCQSPFDDNVIRKMTNLAYALIPWTVVSSISSGLSTGLLNGNIKLNFTVNISMVVTILIIFALTFVFKYGAVLQQESDETL